MIQEQLGIRIKQLRIQNTNLSQEAFAYKIGLDRTYYSSVENGYRNISLNNIKKIADGLEISLAELFKGVEDIKVN